MPDKPRTPWSDKVLGGWSIVGMNHYFVGGKKQLFVAMMKDGRCIQEEGNDDEYLWNRLWHKAAGGVSDAPGKPRTLKENK